jgi:hypothetical protein
LVLSRYFQPSLMLVCEAEACPSEAPFRHFPREWGRLRPYLKTID